MKIFFVILEIDFMPVSTLYFYKKVCVTWFYSVNKIDSTNFIQGQKNLPSEFFSGTCDYFFLVRFKQINRILQGKTS